MSVAVKTSQQTKLVQVTQGAIAGIGAAVSTAVQAAVASLFSNPPTGFNIATGVTLNPMVIFFDATDYQGYQEIVYQVNN